MKLCPKCQRCFDDADTVCSFDSTALAPSRHGSRMIADKYRVDKLLGRGGMGAVYEGTHVDLERPVAIKLLLPDFIADAEALERFRREARAAARLNHPHVADTYDYGSLPEGGAYIVMELIAGKTLRERMDEAGQLPFAEALEIMRQVTSGVEAAHRSGITHRDLKPSNIILTHDHDNHMLAKVVDFSVAKLKEGTTSGSALTATGSLIGTPRYMAPEQCADNRADSRSDIYSLGIILYEMLAGRAPFEGPTTTAIAIKHIQEPPPPVEKFRPDTPVALRELIEQSLAKAPSGRPQTAQEFARRLGEAARELPSSEFDAQPSNAVATSASLSITDRRPADTNPQNSPSDSDTERTGEPTREEAIEDKASDPPSVQSYAITLGEPDEEVETKVTAKDAVTAPTENDEELSAEAVDKSGTVKAHTETAKVSQTEKASTDKAPQAESNFPLLSEHSRTTTVAQADSGKEAAHDAQPTPVRSNYPAYAVAAALILLVGVGVYMLAFRGRVAQDAVDNQTASTGNRNSSGVNANNTQPVNRADAVGANNQPALSDANASSSSNASNSSTVDARAELRSLRDAWVNATIARDIDKLMSFYPPVMDTFYRTNKVSRSAVRAEKQRMIEQSNSIEIETSEPEIALGKDGRTATMTFRKRWNFRGAQNSSGEVLQVLRWIKTDEGWKITTERDLNVIR